jgi:hypothetical protein
MGFFAATVPTSGELKQTISDKTFAQKDGRAAIALQMISPDKKTSEKRDRLRFVNGQKQGGRNATDTAVCRIRKVNRRNGLWRK